MPVPNEQDGSAPRPLVPGQLPPDVALRVIRAADVLRLVQYQDGVLMVLRPERGGHAGRLLLIEGLVLRTACDFLGRQEATEAREVTS